MHDTRHCSSHKRNHNPFRKYMLFAQAREESALRRWNCCSYMSVVLVSDYVYLWNRKFKGFAVVCDLFWKKHSKPFKFILKMHGNETGRFVASLWLTFRKAPSVLCWIAQEIEVLRVSFFYFSVSFPPEGSGWPLLWRTARTRSLTGIERHQLRSHAGRGGDAACAHTRGNAGVNLSPLRSHIMAGSSDGE